MDTRIKLELWDSEGSVEVKTSNKVSIRLARLILIHETGISLSDGMIRSVLKEPKEKAKKKEKVKK